MFNTSNGYSLSDIAAVTGNKNNGGFGDGDYWWIILLFLFAGNGNWGFGGNGAAGRAGGSLREEISYGFDMNNLENGVRGIQQGFCDGFYAMNTGMLNGFAGVQNAMCQGFAGVNSAITADTIANMQNTNVLANGVHDLSTQLAQCCCDNRYALATGFADLNYNIATQGCDTRRAVADATRDIIASNDAGVRAVLDFLTQDKIATLTAENQSLKFAASQSAQNAYISANQEAQTARLINALQTPCPVPAYVVPNPNCCYGAYAQDRFGLTCGC